MFCLGVIECKLRVDSERRLFYTVTDLNTSGILSTFNFERVPGMQIWK